MKAMILKMNATGLKQTQWVKNSPRCTRKNEKFHDKEHEYMGRYARGWIYGYE